MRRSSAANWPTSRSTSSTYPGGGKIPRKGGPGITQSDLLVINKTDLAPLIGADLDVMARDSRTMRGSGPFLFAQVTNGSHWNALNRPSIPFSTLKAMTLSDAEAGVWRYTPDVESAEERRARMQVRVYPSLRAHHRDDYAYWAALPVAVRVLQVWQLSEEQWRMRGEFPDEPGLCRSVARVHRP